MQYTSYFIRFELNVSERVSHLICHLSETVVYFGFVSLVIITKMCHVLLCFQFLQVGDPLEKALKGIDWSYKSNEKALPKK